MRWFCVILWVPLSVASFPAPAAAPSRPDPAEYQERDGEKEALADLRSGRPLKLYYSWQWGEGLRLPVVGLQFCDADESEDVKTARAVFVALPELEFAEDRSYTPEGKKLGSSAWTFGRAYNRTMWRLKRSAVVALCSKATVDD
jgi:hypothetical protein